MMRISPSLILRSLRTGVLANLEGTNAILIERGMGKEARFEILSQAAISQYRRLANEPQLVLME
jgi:hypothetical protein